MLNPNSAMARAAGGKRIVLCEIDTTPCAGCGRRNGQQGLPASEAIQQLDAKKSARA